MIYNEEYLSKHGSSAEQVNKYRQIVLEAVKQALKRNVNITVPIPFFYVQFVVNDLPGKKFIVQPAPGSLADKAIIEIIIRPSSASKD